MKTTHIFTYGSLMYDPVWQSLVTQNYAFQTGLVRGFTRKSVVQQTYPALIPSAHTASCVSGKVYLNVSAEDCIKLDAFEGEEYDRISLKVELETGGQILADTYVFKPEFYHRVDKSDWSVAEFEKQGLNQFLQHYKGFK
ncbi:gamma-glutamylcyclotransferase family protein [Thiosulfativibrio zosterae]|uniref:Putative gamma-glutamylcyclotransferase n=1 Tax=Thiosulfativibrio zosterae TaxID=2675053 RepID=A0A6F8PND3_9GAMM|nr:gamma-glutamylcyclotransferase family protein [Thiosulfativibrio zosterae]BBP43619.1 hypothetical protein THMIRHAT_13650 [Thiosulfativibrio zosterae]